MIETCRRCGTETDGSFKYKGILCEFCHNVMNTVTEVNHQWRKEEPKRVFDQFSLPKEQRSNSSTIKKHYLAKERENSKKDGTLEDDVFDMEFDYILEAKCFWYLRYRTVGGQGVLIDKETMVMKCVGGIYAELEDELLDFEHGIRWWFCDLIIKSCPNKPLVAEKFDNRVLKVKLGKYLDLISCSKETMESICMYKQDELLELLEKLPCKFQSLRIGYKDILMFKELDVEYEISEGRECS